MNDGVLFTREEGGSDVGDERLVISTFNNNEARDGYRKVAEGFGAIMVWGDRWSVGVDTEETAAQVQKVLGGKVA